MCPDSSVCVSVGSGRVGSVVSVALSRGQNSDTVGGVSIFASEVFHRTWTLMLSCARGRELKAQNVNQGESLCYNQH